MILYEKNSYKEYFKELDKIKKVAEFMTLYLKDEEIEDKRLKKDDLKSFKKIKDELSIIAYGEPIICSVPSDIPAPKDD